MYAEINSFALFYVKIEVKPFFSASVAKKIYPKGEFITEYSANHYQMILSWKSVVHCTFLRWNTGANLYNVNCVKILVL